MQAIRARGFTLIEILIATLIVAILAMIAYPAYTDYVRKSRRSAAIAELNEMRLAEERWRANNPQYTTDMTDLGYAADPFIGNHYDYDVTVADAISYTLVARAKGDQIQDKKGGVSCAVLATNHDRTHNPAVCW